DYWTRANRPKEIEIKFSDDSTEVLALDDEMKPGELLLSSPKVTSKVRLRIRSVYAGTTWLDTPISEVQVFNADPEESATVRAVGASSTMPPDGDGAYDPVNLTDGLVDSMWCEGTEGDGVGEWFEVTLAGATRVSKLSLINGNGSALTWWMKGNR